VPKGGRDSTAFSQLQKEKQMTTCKFIMKCRHCGEEYSDTGGDLNHWQRGINENGKDNIINERDRLLNL
jgi:hypothetical protein